MRYEKSKANDFRRSTRTAVISLSTRLNDRQISVYRK